MFWIGFVVGFVAAVLVAVGLTLKYGGMRWNP